jgi:hypothetical protein
VYEVRFKGRWSGSVERALAHLGPVADGRDTVIAVVDAPALLALMVRASELGLVIEGVTRTAHRSPESG